MGAPRSLCRACGTNRNLIVVRGKKKTPTELPQGSSDDLNILCLS